MRSITPDRNQQELQEEGGTDFGFAFGDEGRFRVSVFRQKGNLALVLRLIPSKILTFEEIGLPKICQALCRRPRGMFLVTGPTGSGKTTTLYAIWTTINKPDINIITIEDPVEYELTGINQIPVNPKRGLTFANGLRSILRQDPDVMLVGEIRDFETAQIAIESALTGHLVLSTLHTNTAIGAIPRLVDIGIPGYLLVDSLIGVLAQRLVRRVCEHCAEPAEITPELLAWLDENVGTPRIGRGCGECNDTGLSGRTLISELFLPDDEVGQVMRASSEAASIEEAARRQGFKSMLVDGMERVRQGVTTMEEVLRVARNHRLEEV